MKKIFLLLAVIALVSFTTKESEPQLTITMSLSQWQTVLKAVRKLPMDEAEEINNAILTQANAQMKPPAVDSTKHK